MRLQESSFNLPARSEYGGTDVYELQVGVVGGETLGLSGYQQTVVGCHKDQGDNPAATSAWSMMRADASGTASYARRTCRSRSVPANSTTGASTSTK